MNKLSILQKEGFDTLYLSQSNPNNEIPDSITLQFNELGIVSNFPVGKVKHLAGEISEILQTLDHIDKIVLVFDGKIVSLCIKVAPSVYWSDYCYKTMGEAVANAIQGYYIDKFF